MGITHHTKAIATVGVKIPKLSYNENHDIDDNSIPLTKISDHTKNAHDVLGIGGGEQGPIGPQGPQGIQGETGPVGVKGDKGDKGDIGDIGPQGSKGDTGETGLMGSQGPQGEIGLTGPKGDTGDMGAKGDKGDKGDIGDTGQQGQQGIQGIQGDVGPQGPAGAGIDTHFITLTSNYTLASQTALQKMFNAPTNGAFTAEANSTYYFECEFNLSSLSTTSGNYSFGFLGTATITRIKYWSLANKGAVTPVNAALTLGSAATAVALVAASTTATGQASIRGKLVIGTGGTIIPAVGLGVAAVAIVNADASFKIWKAGSNTVQSYGNWS